MGIMVTLFQVYILTITNKYLYFKEYTLINRFKQIFIYT